MTELPTFDEFVDVLRERLFAADALKPGELHDFHELMSDYADKVGENWNEYAFDELEAQGHLDPASGKAMGPTMTAGSRRTGAHTSASSRSRRKTRPSKRTTDRAPLSPGERGRPLGGSTDGVDRQARPWETAGRPRITQRGLGGGGRRMPAAVPGGSRSGRGERLDLLRRKQGHHRITPARKREDSKLRSLRRVDKQSHAVA